MSAGDPAWILKEQLVLLLSESSLPTDAPECLRISVQGLLWGGPEDSPFSLLLKSHLLGARTQEKTMAKTAATRHNLSLGSVPFHSTELSGVSDSCQRSKRTLGTLELEFYRQCGC